MIIMHKCEHIKTHFNFAKGTPVIFYEFLELLYLISVVETPVIKRLKAVKILYIRITN